MVCTGCDGYAVCLSSFMLCVPIRSFLYGTLRNNGEEVCMICRTTLVVLDKTYGT